MPSKGATALDILLTEPWPDPNGEVPAADARGLQDQLQHKIGTRSEPQSAEPVMRKLLQELADLLQARGKMDACEAVRASMESWPELDDAPPLGETARHRLSALVSQLLEPHSQARVHNIAARAAEAFAQPGIRAVAPEAPMPGRLKSAGDQPTLATNRIAIDEFKAEYDKIQRSILDPQEQYRALVELRRRSAYGRSRNARIPQTTRSAL